MSSLLRGFLFFVEALVPQSFSSLNDSHGAGDRYEYATFGSDPARSAEA